MPYPKLFPVGLVVPNAKLIDFAKTPLEPYYSQSRPFALVIDNLFTPEECETLLSIAQSGDDKWESALVNAGGGYQVLAKSIRDCTRIMRDDFDTAGWIYERVKPYLEEVMVVDRGSKWGCIAGHRLRDGTTCWKMTRLNERLRFLRYTKDQYFKPHYDGSYVTPDGTESSLLTLHLYLNSTGSISAPGSLRGGATRFLAPDHRGESRYLDVEAKQGRVLIFQHAQLIHSGEKVSSGVKYTMRTDIMYKLVEK